MRARLQAHTSLDKTGGEIRGLLHAVPELRTYALFGVGLGVVAWVVRRRRSV